MVMGTKARFSLILGVAAIVAACGGSAARPAYGGGAAAPATPTTSSGSAQSAAATAAGQGDSGGVADTPANPDRTYICAAAAMSGRQTVAYLTVAGTDAAAARSECTAVTRNPSWTAVSSSPFHENFYTPVCFITFDTGELTARVYTSDSGTFAEGVGLCNPLLQRHGLATLPPS
ncbi:MAG: hypothetical protein P4M09_16585 [Devosia sp.]|nr:hypothetical protein [Devosia sp.]